MIKNIENNYNINKHLFHAISSGFVISLTQVTETIDFILQNITLFCSYSNSLQSMPTILH